MMTDVNDNEITIEKKPTVGERLCHAREQKKLSIAEIASELRLSKQTIELIENAKWSELHGRAYARGYFTNYVKLLGLPEDELLAAFNVEYNIVEPTLSVARHQVEISNKKFIWLPSVLFITVLVIAWFAYQQMKNTAEIVMEDASPLFLPTQDNTANSTNETSKEFQEIVPDSQQEINEIEQVLSPDAETLNTGDNNELELVIAASEPINDELIPENIEVVSVDAMLDLRFSDDCWVEVKDAGNNILLKKLMTKDESIVLKGRAPLTVMLGRKSVTQVRFNDELFDPSAFTQRDVARFTLGAES
tara:strand:- start:300 stop:1214 length:915 start_codon:yes stop_codon:yes gene_type:complete